MALRVFTKDIGRYQRGDERDYSKDVWDNIARSYKEPLSSFTTTVPKLVENSRGGKRR